MSGIEDPVSAFWLEIDRQLADVPLEVNLERDDFYSEPDWDVFRMGYTGLGGYRLFSWLSMPRGQGPFPALLTSGRASATGLAAASYSRWASTLRLRTGPASLSASGD